LKNEANHTLASLAAMAQPALVAGVMVLFGLIGASMTVERAGSMGQTGCSFPARANWRGRAMIRVRCVAVACAFALTSWCEAAAQTRVKRAEIADYGRTWCVSR
jgi:hypothetical protein